MERPPCQAGGTDQWLNLPPTWHLHLCRNLFLPRPPFSFCSLLSRESYECMLLKSHVGGCRERSRRHCRVLTSPLLRSVYCWDFLSSFLVQTPVGADFGRNYKPPIPKLGGSNRWHLQFPDQQFVVNIGKNIEDMRPTFPQPSRLTQSYAIWYLVMQIPETVTPKCGVYYEYIWIYPISSICFCPMSNAIPSFLCVCNEKQFGEKA